jgi:formylglycine-generating enzyme required for sulfatase activity
MIRVVAALFSLGTIHCTALVDLDHLNDTDAGDEGVGGRAHATGSSASSGSTSGNGGETGQGGAPSSSSSGGQSAQAGCSSAMGPAMVDLGAFCIDSTEVTNAQYAAWLATAPSLNGQPSYCVWNTSYVPAQSWPQPTMPDHPVTYVDWCDAHAFCAAAGKRLCGQIGGGPNGFDQAALTDPNQSEWHHACTSGLGNNYPYGVGYQAATCVGSGYDAIPDVQTTDVLQPVGDATACHGSSAPFDGVFDLSGNVGEWVDSCDAYVGAEDSCHRRGGSHISLVAELKCQDDSWSDRQQATGRIGFRCCAG